MAEGDGREAVEYAKCSADCAYFVDAYGVIDDAQGHGEGGGVMPFKLWPAQVGVVWRLMSERLVIILKARQLGISWICCGYVLWLCFFSPGQLVLLYSQGELEAIELLRRVKALYERLPAWMRSAGPAVSVDNTTLFGWENGSRIQSLPATQRAGRGNAASLVIVDEAAFLQWGDRLYTALKPTIDGGGQLVILSTANGLGNLFHRLWVKASAGLNAFRTVFLPWWSRPGRDSAWYARQVSEATDPSMVHQEYPSNPNEAFVSSGRVRFQPEWISAQAGNVRPGLPRRSWPEALRGIDALTLYSPPWHPPLADIAPRLLLAADVAEGLEHGDFSAAVLVDATTWDELAELHGHWEPDEFARLLFLLSEAVGAPVLVERNNHGHAVLATLKALGSRRVALGHDGRPGWLTNAQTKPRAVDSLAVALRDGLTKVRGQAALDELQVYRVRAGGETSAPPGYHDDRVMCRAIAMGAIAMGLGEKKRITIR